MKGIANPMPIRQGPPPWRRPELIIWAAFVAEIAWALFGADVWGIGMRSRPPHDHAVLYAQAWLAGAIVIAVGAAVLAWRASRR